MSVADMLSFVLGALVFAVGVVFGAAIATTAQKK